MSTGRDAIHPELAKRLTILLKVLSYYGLPAYFTSGRRSTEEQAKLYSEWRAGRRSLPAAPPGYSKHERGLAFDIGGSARALLVAGRIAPLLGLTWGGNFRVRDPVHFEF